MSKLDEIVKRIVKMDGLTDSILDSICRLEFHDLNELANLSDDELHGTFEYFKNEGERSDFYDEDVMFMRITREIANSSRDPNAKVGCIAVKDGQIIYGYNRFPDGIKQDWRMHVKRIKLNLVLHAEMNMLINALNNGVSLDGASAYIYGLPVCSSCIKPLIQTKLSKIIMCDATGGNSKSWSINSETYKNTEMMLIEKGIGFRMLDHRRLEV